MPLEDPMTVAEAALRAVLAPAFGKYPHLRCAWEPHEFGPRAAAPAQSGRACGPSKPLDDL
jgi:hypothetical protein